MRGFNVMAATQARKIGRTTGRAKYRKAIVPIAIRTNCTGVAEAALTAIGSADGGSPLGALAGGATATVGSPLGVFGWMIAFPRKKLRMMLKRRLTMNWVVGFACDVYLFAAGGRLPASGQRLFGFAFRTFVRRVPSAFFTCGRFFLGGLLLLPGRWLDAFFLFCRLIIGLLPR